MFRKVAFVTALFVVLAACSPQAAPVLTTPTETPVPSQTPTQENVNSPYPAASEVPSTPGENSIQPGTSSNPLYPVPGEDKVTRGEVSIDSTQILKQSSSGGQILLQVTGSLPTPCHLLRGSAAAPDAQNQIQVEVYSLADSSKACTQVLQPFNTAIPLGTFPDGKYTVLINGKQVGEFSNP